MLSQFYLLLNFNPLSSLNNLKSSADDVLHNNNDDGNQATRS